MTLLRYRFHPPMTVGKRTRLPSGRVYHLRWGVKPLIDVDPADVETLLTFKGECCSGARGKMPLFELAEPTNG